MRVITASPKGTCYISLDICTGLRPRGEEASHDQFMKIPNYVEMTGTPKAPRLMTDKKEP